MPSWRELWGIVFAVQFSRDYQWGCGNEDYLPIHFGHDIWLYYTKYFRVVLNHLYQIAWPRELTSSCKNKMSIIIDVFSHLSFTFWWKGCWFGLHFTFKEQSRYLPVLEPSWDEWFYQTYKIAMHYPWCQCSCDIKK
jgi:hypothetical protein